MNGSDRKNRVAFTLVELLVVIGIIIVLATMLIPTVVKYRKIIKANITLSTINHLEMGCRAYHVDFGEFPPSAAPPGFNAGNWSGAQLLPLFLIGYAPKGNPGDSLDKGDGVDGPGFRVQLPRGQIYGPYPDQSTPALAVGYPSGGGPRFFVDAFGGPILYYRGGDPNLPNLFNDNDNKCPPLPDPPRVPANISAYAKGSGIPLGPNYLRKDLLLISAGADANWCPTNVPVSASDDVTNLFSTP
jgi:type II secretory pathway pseudopilin PulG